MGELLDILQQSQNWLYAFFITFSACIWLISSFGLFGGAQTDASLEADADLDVGVELDADLDADAEFSIAEAFSHVTAFLGIGKVPLSVVLTALMFGQGVLGMSFNYWLNVVFNIPSSWFSHIAIFLTSFMASFFGTALLTKLLAPVFRDYGKVSKANEMVGQTAILTSSRVNTQFGQASIKMPNGDRIEVSVRTYDDQNEIGYGSTLLIVDYLPEKNIYLIEKMN